jgi:hypothetical protein
VLILPRCFKHYLHFITTTNHLSSLSINASNGVSLAFPSVTHHKHSHLLDYHEFTIVHPKQTPTTSILSSPIANSATSESPLSCLFLHQCLGLESAKVEYALQFQIFSE